MKYDRETFKTDLLATLTEFLGTVLFLLIGLGGIQAAATSEELVPLHQTTMEGRSVNTVASIEQLTYISVSMGLGLTVAAWMFYRVSGSVFNPNVALALVLCKVLTVPRFLLYCVAQLVGAIVASAILDGLTPGPLAVATSLGAGVGIAQGVFIEMFITTALCLAVLLLAAEKHKSTHLAPIGIGLTLFASHLWAVVYTGAAMNTARAFGPSVVAGSFDGEHWIYWVGPGLGGLLAAAIYHGLKYIKYWELNPGQDDSREKESPDLCDDDTPTNSSRQHNV